MRLNTPPWTWISCFDYTVILHREFIIVTPEKQARLRWQCRRGMLELDILLGHFFDNCFLALSTSEQLLFEQLLSCQDQDLFNWLIQREIPNDPAIALMIERILSYAKTAA